jgi:excisionase family DNA binding protein
MMETVEEGADARSGRRMLTIREVADEVGVSEKSVRRWIKAGALSAWRHGQIVRISCESLDRFLGRE